MVLGRVLAVILAVWEPLNVAGFLAPVFPTIGQRGYGTAVFAAARIVVAGISVAAGIALWRRQPDAAKLAALALVLSTVAGVVTYTARLLPTNVIPSDVPFRVAAIICFNGAWLAYLIRYYGVTAESGPSTRS
jgi:chromate transport protein ChrA